MAERRPAAPMPHWPILMDRATACRFTTYTQAQFNALVVSGLLPPPREHLPGEKRWHRRELERCLDRLYQLEDQHSDEKSRDDARRALDSFQVPAPRRADARPRR